MLAAHELNPKNHKLTHEQWENFYRHYFAMNEFRYRYRRPMIVNNGVRSLEEHLAIYKIANQRRKNMGLDEINVPMGSAHLLAAATDFRDIDHSIYNFCTRNEILLASLNIYVEHKDYTLNWCHLQSVPPKSGNRFFIPY
jgi:hypothetical protein